MPDQPKPELALFKANLIRMVIYLQEELLSKGLPIYDGELAPADHGLSLYDQVGGLVALPRAVAAELGASPDGGSLASLSAADRALIQEIDGPQGMVATVMNRFQAAPKIARP